MALTLMWSDAMFCESGLVKQTKVIIVTIIAIFF